MDKILGAIGWLSAVFGGILIFTGFSDGEKDQVVIGAILIGASISAFAVSSIISILKEIRDGGRHS